MSGAAHEPTQLLSGLSLQVVERGTTIVIDLDGELDLSGRHLLQRTIADAFARQPDRVQLDFHRLTFMDSTGVHAAQEASRHAAQTGIALTLVPAAPAVQRIFELAGVGSKLRFVTPRTDPQGEVSARRRG